MYIMCQVCLVNFNRLMCFSIIIHELLEDAGIFQSSYTYNVKMRFIMSWTQMVTFDNKLNEHLYYTTVFIFKLPA